MIIGPVAMDESTALMSPVSTRSLDELVKDRGPLPVPLAMVLLGAITQALIKSVEAKGVQQPLTAATIRIAWPDGQSPTVILLEGDGTIDLSHGADVFSLGVVAFITLVGRAPKLDETLADALPSVPAGVDRLVGKLLSRNLAERPSAAHALRQFEELALVVAEPSIKAAAPLSAPPLIKRGPPIGELRTDAKQWALDAEDESTRLVAPAPDPQVTGPIKVQPNPFEDDEQTATVKGTLGTEEDEPTRLAELSATYKSPGKAAPPIAPSMPTRRLEQPFVATKGDLMGRTLDDPADSKAPPARMKPRRPRTPQEQLLALAKRQPPWVWGAIGVGLAFFVLLLIALTR
jgi:hypothetical protein